MLRFIIRYLMSNEQLVQKIADSRPMRKAAQLVVYIINRSTSGTYKIPSDPKKFASELASVMKEYTGEFKRRIESAKEELKKK